MRILFLAPQPFFQARGTPINVRNVLRVLSGAGHSADLVTYHVGENVDIRNVRIRRIPALSFVKSVPIGPSAVKIPLDILMFLKALCILRRDGNYDCVHAVEESVFIALLLRKRFGIPYVYDMDSVISDQLRYTGKLRNRKLLDGVEFLEKQAVEHSLAVLTVCSSLSDRVRGISPGKRVFQVEDCPMGVEDGRSGLTRRELNVKEDDFVILYTGNLESYQGAAMLIRSFGYVLREHPRARLVIAGGEPAQVEDLKRRARQAGVEWSVSFAGKVPVEEVPSLLDIADILVSPRLEGTNTPLKIYDYLASGKPLVATDLPMHTQVLDRRTAVLVRPDPRSFSEGMLRLIRSPSARKRLGRNGKKLVLKNYGFPVFREKIEELYGFVENSLGERGET